MAKFIPFESFTSKHMARLRRMAKAATRAFVGPNGERIKFRVSESITPEKERYLHIMMDNCGALVVKGAAVIPDPSHPSRSALAFYIHNCWNASPAAGLVQTFTSGKALATTLKSY